MDIYSLLILSLVFIPPFLLFFRRGKNEKLPPGPFRLPIIGNLHQIIGDLPHRGLRRLANVYGPLMFLHIGSKPTLVISSAYMVKKIFQTHDIAFSGRPGLYAADKITYKRSDIAFAPYGEHWREVKKVSVLELLSAKKVQSFRTVREEEVALLMALIRSSEGPVDLSSTVLNLASDVTCRVAFGRKYDLKDGFHAMLQEIENLTAGFNIADFIPWLSWIHKIDGVDAKIEKNFKKFNAFLDKVIEEHLNSERAKAEGGDLVDVMLRVQKEPIHKIELTNVRIKGIIGDMFIAGSGTSASVLVWSMTELIKNPTIMKKAQEEVRGLVGNKTMVEESDLPRLNCIKMIIKETLRVHSPGSLLLPRETLEKCTVEGYEIPAKTTVFIHANMIMNDETFWEKPEEYWPERFLDNPIDFTGKEFDFTPFGVGRRICPGINFAVSLTELVLANLLHCFNWDLPHGMERGNLDMKETFGIVNHKEIPLQLVAKRYDLCSKA